jgi:hypothetical protein
MKSKLFYKIFLLLLCIFIIKCDDININSNSNSTQSQSNEKNYIQEAKRYVFKFMHYIERGTIISHELIKDTLKLEYPIDLFLFMGLGCALYILLSMFKTKVR